MDYTKIIMDFFKEKGAGDDIGIDTDLFGSGFVNSLFALEIVVFLEDTFNIRIKNKDINEENFRTLQNISALVERITG